MKYSIYDWSRENKQCVGSKCDLHQAIASAGHYQGCITIEVDSRHIIEMSMQGVQTFALQKNDIR